MRKERKFNKQLVINYIKKTHQKMKNWEIALILRNFTRENFLFLQNISIENCRSMTHNYNQNWIIDMSLYLTVLYVNVFKNISKSVRIFKSTVCLSYVLHLILFQNFQFLFISIFKRLKVSKQTMPTYFESKWKYWRQMSSQKISRSCHLVSRVTRYAVWKTL